MNKEQIKEIREKLKISQEEFARLIGVSLITLSRWERGHFKPSRMALEKIKTLCKSESINATR